MSLSAAEAARSPGSDDEDGGNDGADKVKPLVTAKLTLCYLLLLVAGVYIGLVARDLSWVNLKKYHRICGTDQKNVIL